MEYKDLLKTTIEICYPKYLQEKVKKKLEANNILSSEENLFTATGESVIVNENSQINEIHTALDNKTSNTIFHIEDLEFYNAYKYSTLFNYEVYEEKVVEKMIENGSIINFDDKKFDVCQDFTKEVRIVPTYRKINDSIDCLKFSNQITGFNPNEFVPKTIKYTILVLIHKNLNTVEIRLNKVKSIFKNNDDYFYKRQIIFVKSWLEEYLNFELEPVNLPPVIDYIRPKLTGDGKVKVTAQAMDLATGSKAILDTGINDEFVLPLLGELKNLIADNKHLFNANEKTKEIESLLNTFIFETEETASLPWISLTWTNEVKSRAVKVKFIFNSEYTLLYYYGSNAGMERMNDVTRYLIDNQREYLKQETE